MKLMLNGMEYDIPEPLSRALVAQFAAMLLAHYEKLDSKMQLLFMPVTRGILYKMERAATTEEAKKAIRPPKGGDPTLHLAELFLQTIQEGMKHAIASIDTEEDSASVTALNLALASEGPGGGQVVAYGSQWFREDDGSQDARRAIGTALSDGAPLHLGFEA